MKALSRKGSAIESWFTPFGVRLWQTGLSQKNKMINEYEVPSYIVDDLPELNVRFKKSTSVFDVFKSIGCLANYTRAKVVQHDLRVVQKCFALAEKMYSKGNAKVKTAIEHVYVFSFSSLMNSCTEGDKKELHSVMPPLLRTLYLQQVLQ